jgi:hypothetical protein
MAGHEGIQGNEMANEEAKEAACRYSSEKPLLPPYLRKHILINPPAIKRAHHKKLKNTWTEAWKASERGQRDGKIDSTSPSKKFLKAISHTELSHNAASCIMQFRLTHAPVNHLLKRIKKVDKAMCPTCGADKETIGHFLLICPSYTYEHWALAQEASKLHKCLSLKTLLDCQGWRTPDINFVVQVQLAVAMLSST